MQPVDLPSFSVNILCSQKTLCQFPSTFHAAGRSSVNFHLISVRPVGITKIFLAAERPYVNFSQLSTRQGDFTSFSVKFPCGWKNFRKVLFNFNAAERPSIIFSWLSERTVDFQSTSVNFHCCQVNFRQHLSTLWVAIKLSVKFSCGLETFHKLPSTFRAPYFNYRHLSMRPADLLSNSVPFPCCR